MKKIDKLLALFLNIHSTIFFNFRYFSPSVAWRLPVLVSYNVLFLNTAGSVIIPKDIRTCMIKIGFGKIDIFDQNHSRTIWDVKGTGKVIFQGKADVGHGSKISVGSNGELILGRNFKISAESTIICHKRIEFGNDCLLSWGITLIDTDFHEITDMNDNVLNLDAAIIIGDHVWIGLNSLITKDVIIGSGCVVAAGTRLYKTVEGLDQIIGGNPPTVLCKNIKWKK